MWLCKANPCPGLPLVEATLISGIAQGEPMDMAQALNSEPWGYDPCRHNRGGFTKS